MAQHISADKFYRPIFLGRVKLSVIGDLNIYQDGQVFVAHTDMQKAEALCDFFSSVFVRESSEVFDTLPTRWKTEDTEPLSVD